MPSLWWRKPDNKLKKCSERRPEVCDSVPTDLCCSVIPCQYCLIWDPDYGVTRQGKAEFSGSAWTGTIAGAVFSAYWERNQYTLECEFVVTLNTVEIYRVSCYGGQSCRDSSDSAQVTIGDASGLLTWNKVLLRPLEDVRDPDTGCEKKFCGDCDCSCLSLCATLVTPAPDCCRVKFEIPDVSYPCDTPRWEASTSCRTNTYGVAVWLDVDKYDDSCILRASIGDEEMEPIRLSQCTGWTAVFRAYDGTTLSVTCDECDCKETEACSVGCCWPLLFNEIYPCGYRAPIPFEITAPGCDLDGRTGTFTPTGVAQRGECGECEAAPPDSIGSTLGQRKFNAPAPTFVCSLTPCTISIVLLLTCENSDPVLDGSEACCGRFRLWVGTSERMQGYDGRRPAGGDPGMYWIEVAPSSCGCDPFSAIFDVPLEPDCQDIFDTGACIYEPRCCTPFCGGFTVTI